MAPQPEQQARGNIDRLLMAAGWHVCDASAANIHAAYLEYHWNGQGIDAVFEVNQVV